MVRLIIYSKRQIPITSTAPPPLPTAIPHRSPNSSSSVYQFVLSPLLLKATLCLCTEVLLPKIISIHNQY